MCAWHGRELAPHDSVLVGPPGRAAVPRAQHGWHAAQLRRGAADERKVAVDGLAPGACLAVVQHAG